MSLYIKKFFKDFNFWNLDDVSTSSLSNDDMIVYNSTTLKFENKKQPRHGRDFNRKSRVSVAGVPITGNAFQTFDSLTFDVNGPDTLNEFRINADFTWRHNATTNSALFRIVLDGNVLGEVLDIEPKDASSTQRLQNNILEYITNLSIGSHTLELQARPENSSRITTLHRSHLELWRTA